VANGPITICKTAGCEGLYTEYVSGVCKAMHRMALWDLKKLCTHQVTALC